MIKRILTWPFRMIGKLFYKLYLLVTWPFRKLWKIVTSPFRWIKNKFNKKDPANEGRSVVKAILEARDSRSMYEELMGNVPEYCYTVMYRLMTEKWVTFDDAYTVMIVVSGINPRGISKDYMMLCLKEVHDYYETEDGAWFNGNHNQFASDIQ